MALETEAFEFLRVWNQYRNWSQGNWMNRTPEQKAAYLPKVASGALNEAKTCARDRKQLGKALGEFQLIQAMLADSHRELIRTA